MGIYGVGVRTPNTSLVHFQDKFSLTIEPIKKIIFCGDYVLFLVVRAYKIYLKTMQTVRTINLAC